MKNEHHIEYTPQIIEAICVRMAKGESIRTICKSKGMPCMSSVFNWLAKYPEFVEQYQKAMDARSAYWAEELLDIADDGRNDWIQARAEEGAAEGEGAETWRLDREHINRSRLRVDTRKWLLSKLQPKKYGDSMAITGAGGGNISIVIHDKPKEEQG